jgi:hypothetical protein
LNVIGFSSFHPVHESLTFLFCDTCVIIWIRFLFT